MTGVLEFDVVGVHQLRGRDVDQPMAKDVGTQQYLALAALEPAQVHLVLRQHHPVPVEVLEHKPFGADRAAYDAAIVAEIAGEFSAWTVIDNKDGTWSVGAKYTIGNGARGARYYAALLLTGALMGALAMALKDIKDGRDPRKWLDEKTWLDPYYVGEAILQAGGLGIFGDFIRASDNRMGGGRVRLSCDVRWQPAADAEDEAGDVERVAERVFGEFRAALEGARHAARGLPGEAPAGVQEDRQAAARSLGGGVCLRDDGVLVVLIPATADIVPSNQSSSP